MTYTRKIYGFCVAVLCTFFMIGCSAVKETSDIAFELDLSTIFSADSGARQVFDDKGNIKLNIFASICKAKDNSQTVGHGDFIKQVDEEIFYPATKTTKIEFKDLEIGEKYSVYVDISTVEEGDEQPTSVFYGETIFEVKAGTNVVRFTIGSKEANIDVILRVYEDAITIPTPTGYYGYVVFELHNGEEKHVFFQKVNSETNSFSQNYNQNYNNYTFGQKVEACAYYVLSTKGDIKETIFYVNGEIEETFNDNKCVVLMKTKNPVKRMVLPEYNSSREYSIPLTLALQDGSQSLITSGLALPVITADNYENCTIATIEDKNNQITITPNTPGANASVTFTASSIDNSNNPYNDVLYAWFLNGNVVVDNSGDPITTDYIEVTLSGNDDIQKTDDPSEPKINTLMLIVSKNSEMQSAIWQFTVVE